MLLFLWQSDYYENLKYAAKPQPKVLLIWSLSGYQHYYIHYNLVFLTILWWNQKQVSSVFFGIDNHTLIDMNMFTESSV